MSSILSADHAGLSFAGNHHVLRIKKARAPGDSVSGDRVRRGATGNGSSYHKCMHLQERLMKIWRKKHVQCFAQNREKVR